MTPVLTLSPSMMVVSNANATHIGNGIERPRLEHTGSNARITGARPRLRAMTAVATEASYKGGDYLGVREYR